MSLASYKPAQRTVMLGETTLVVRGLSLTDISVLIREHFPDMNEIVDFITSESISGEDFGAIALSIVTRAPGLAANIIALAAGEPDQAGKAMQISAPGQITIIQAIGEATFTEAGGIKNFMEKVAALLGQMGLNKKALTKTKTKAG